MIGRYEGRKNQLSNQLLELWIEWCIKNNETNRDKLVLGHVQHLDVCCLHHVFFQKHINIVRRQCPRHLMSEQQERVLQNPSLVSGPPLYSSLKSTMQIMLQTQVNGLYVWMKTDQIRMESDSDNTFYHIFTRIQIWIRMLSNTNTKRISRIRIRIRIFIRFERQHFPILFIDNL
jgi:hypothetical protein